MRLETRLQGQRHNIIELEDDPAALARGEFIEVPVFDLTLTTGLAEALLHDSLVSGTSGTVGFTGKLQDSSTDGVIPIVPGADQRAAGFFVLERAQRGPWSVLAGGRTDVVRVDAAGLGPRAFGTPTWSVGANLDLADGLDLKVSVGSACTSEIRDGYSVYRYTQADALLRGGEASVDVEATPWLTLSGRGDYVRGTNVTRDEPLPLMPPRRFVLGAEAHGERLGDWAWVGAEVEHVAEPDRLNPLDIAVDGYTLVHLSGGVRGRLLGREGSVDLRVRNAGNVSFRDFLSRYKAFALDPGRDIVLRIRMGM